MPFFRKSTPEEGAPMSKGSSALAFFFELIQVVAVSLAIIIPVRYFLIQPFYVKGASMEPSFYDHEYLIIDELSYRFKQPERGDIVVFRYPADPSQFFIKRVIGLPGETVEVGNGVVKVYNDTHPNGTVLEEFAYLPPEDQTVGGDRMVTLRNDEYFVMGDNRQASLDSRYFGAVNKSAIVGKVWLRGWPLDRWKVFEKPEYKF